MRASIVYLRDGPLSALVHFAQPEDLSGVFAQPMVEANDGGTIFDVARARSAKLSIDLNLHICTRALLF
ncbi:MAG: hypothetical protein IPL29_07460 [Propionivibrio sp.]|nr:hypothetical protein [Propionivibrio sp.]